MSRVSVDKERLEAIIKEKSECDCTDDDCPLSLDGCKTRPNVDYSFQCNKKLTIIDWLDVKYLPDDSTDEYLLSPDERAILRNLPPKYKYIARDGDCRLYFYTELPTKNKTEWNVSPSGVFWCTRLFEHLFQCIQFTDEKPWLISDLLNAKKPTVDWSKVAVDTKILVRTSDSEKWLKRYFAKYKNGNVYCFIHGYSSFTVPSSSNEEIVMTHWDEAKLYEEDNHED